MTRSESTVPDSGTQRGTPAAQTRVLAGLTSPGNQRLLVDWLNDRDGYTSVEATDADISTIDFDVAVVDSGTIRDHEAEIRAAKADSETFLPVLLVTTDPAGDSGGARGLDAVVGLDIDLVDEVLTTPLVEAVLERRLETLVRTRAQSLALAQRSEQLMLLNRITRHDIRNEMNVVMGWTEALESHTDEEGDEMRARILSSSQHVVDLTQAVREFVEALGTAGDPDLEPVNLERTLTDELEKRRSTFEEAEFTLAGDVPPVRVLANDLLASVFRNLLNNAVQHNDAETPEVTIEADRAGDRVTISVADNGPGIESEVREAVLGRTEEGLDHPAAGIGLYLVETLVDQYGGEVRLSEAESGGLLAEIDLEIAPDVTSGVEANDR